MICTEFNDDVSVLYCLRGGMRREIIMSVGQEMWPI